MSRGGLTERWRKPVIPIDVEETGRLLLIGDRSYCRTTFVLDHEGMERVRLGYVCLNCLEPHERNHPEYCSHCYFPIRTHQDEVFEQMYEGEEHVGPRTTDEEELEIAQELIDRGGRA